LRVALQEWAVCCAALAAGRGIALVRKGGVHERHGGLFAPEHERFVLLPTWLHQDASRLATALAGDLAASATPPPAGSIPVTVWAEVARTWRVTDAERLDRLGEEGLWSAAELRRRFAYRDQPWLHVLVLRVHRLAAPRVIADHPSYAGCRSWIPLVESVDTTASLPVLADAVFAARLAALATVLDA